MQRSRRLKDIMKPWREMPIEEINKIKREKCQYCVFSGKYTVSTDGKHASGITCDYIGIMGHSRGCRPDQCDKFIRREKGYRRRIKTL